MIGYLDLSFRGGLVRARRLFEFFEHELPGATIESLPRPFAAVGTDLRTGEEVWMRKGSLLDALQASVAMPGLITPTQREGRWLVDGGLVNPVPVSLCRALGADRVIAVDLNTTLLGRRMMQGAGADAPEPAPVLPEQAGPREEGTGLQSILRKLAAELRERIGSDDDDVREETPTIYDVMANSVNIMQVRIGRSRMAGDPPELLITPRMHDFGVLDFDRAEEAIAEGRRAVARALASSA
jgi:NTE family protein